MRLLRHCVVVYLLAVLPSCGGSKPPTGGSNTPDLASVTLQNNTVAAGQQVQGTVALTSAPNSGSVTVNLSSSNTAVAIVQPSASVAQGSTTSTFTVTGVAAGSVTINASLASTTRQAQLTVNAAIGAVANFRVLQGDGSSNTDANFTCPVTRDTSMLSLLNKLDCTFDAGASTGPGGITRYEWTIFNAAGGEAAMGIGIRLVQPFVPCGSFDGVTQSKVTLSVTPAGNSSTTTNQITVQKANPC